MNLSKAIPFAAATFVVASMASVGLPGFSGFVAELQVILGAWSSYPVFALLAGFGIVIGIAYTWRAMQKAFFSEARELSPDHADPLQPMTPPERIGAILLIAATVTIGVYPQLLLNIIVPALNSPLFEGLRKVAGN
jgi:NADH-quinone oxidoreductase subunit M